MNKWHINLNCILMMYYIPVAITTIEKKITSPRNKLAKSEKEAETTRRNRNQSLSTNSTESELDFTSGGFHSDEQVRGHV